MELQPPRAAASTQQGDTGTLNSERARSLAPLEACRARCNSCAAVGYTQEDTMGMASEDLLVTLQILPGFFSNCLFLALYDSVVLVKRAVSLLSCSRPAGSGERPRMLTSAGLRSIWNSFLLDAYKQVGADPAESQGPGPIIIHSLCFNFRNMP